MAKVEHPYLRARRKLASHSCERARTLAEPASERAHALFSPPTIPLAKARVGGGGASGRRRREGGRARRAGTSSRSERVASGPASTHSTVRGGFVGHVRSASPSAHAAQSTSEADRGEGADGLSASGPSPISRRRVPSQPALGDRLPVERGRTCTDVAGGLSTAGALCRLGNGWEVWIKPPVRINDCESWCQGTAVVATHLFRAGARPRCARCSS
eukprot:4730536-Pleurochrysis_carterae.AAC.3